MPETLVKRRSESNKMDSGDRTPFEETLVNNDVEKLLYTPLEQQYLLFLRQRLIYARDQKEAPHDAFDGMSYTQYYDTNDKAAMSYIPPRQNKEETNIVTGTTREKCLAIEAAILNLNFEFKLKAYDEDDVEDVELGSAFSKLIKKSEDIESWKDKEVLLVDEFVRQGTVFVQEDWVEEIRYDKKKIKLSKVNEQLFKTFKSEKKIKEIFKGCARSLLYGPHVYLGNVREFDISKQPYIFIKKVIPSATAKALFGTWPRFKDTPKNIVNTADGEDRTFNTDWTLEEVPQDHYELIIYQDKWNDEFMILLNGVMQLPIEFPMPWASGEYSIAKGDAEPINSFFAYSKSIPAKTKIDQQVLDEMTRLAILKTQKSFLPTVANYSQQILSRAAMMPGNVINDVRKGDIEVFDSSGLNNSEIAMIEMIKKNIDEKSVNPIMQGQEAKAGATATEVLEVQRMAKVRMGLILFGYMNLLSKLGMLRLYNILENWTKPTGKEVDKINNKLEDKYNSYSIESDIPEEGRGTERIIFSEKNIKPNELYDMEEGVQRDEAGKPISVNKPKRPIRYRVINPKVLRSIKYKWYPIVTPTEKETSLTSQIVFMDQLNKAIMLFGPESINQEYAKQRFGMVNSIDASQLFLPNQPQQELMPQEDETAGSIKPGLKQMMSADKTLK